MVQAKEHSSWQMAAMREDLARRTGGEREAGTMKFGNRIQRITTFAAVAFTAISGLVAAVSLEDFRGDWTLLTKVGSSATISDLHVGVNSAGDLAGTIKTMGAETDITQFATEGDFALLHFTMNRGAQPMNLVLRLKLSGDDVSGGVKMGDQGPTISVTGSRAGSEGDMMIRMALAAEAEKAAGKPTLKFADVGDLAGEWEMTVESESSGTVTVPFVVSEVNGMATALLKMEPPIGEQRINNITKTATGFDCRYEISVASQSFKVNMHLALKEGKIEGEIEDEGGIFTIPVHGARKGQGDTVANAGASDSQRAALSGRAPRQRGSGSKTVRGTVGGQRFELYYGEMDTAAPGMNKIPFAQSEGTIWSPGKNGATKLKSPASLDFGGKVIPPGRYGLWTKRTKDGWNLVINEFPDVWSTQHDPEADLAEVPMKVAALETPSETLVIKIEEQEGSGVIRIEFGSDQLSAAFKVLN